MYIELGLYVTFDIDLLIYIRKSQNTRINKTLVVKLTESKNFVEKKFKVHNFYLFYHLV